MKEKENFLVSEIWTQTYLHTASDIKGFFFRKKNFKRVNMLWTFFPNFLDYVHISKKDLWKQKHFWKRDQNEKKEERLYPSIS